VKYRQSFSYSYHVVKFGNVLCYSSLSPQRGECISFSCVEEPPSPSIRTPAGTGCAAWRADDRRLVAETWWLGTRSPGAQHGEVGGGGRCWIVDPRH
jgi:hypothetical protein